MARADPPGAAHSRRPWLIGVAAGLLLLAGLAAAWGFIYVEDARGAARECEVHGLPLRLDLVRIGYGEPAYTSEYVAVWQKKFPHARLVHHGGCCPRSARKALVRYCPECREVARKYRSWRFERPFAD